MKPRKKSKSEPLTVATMTRIAGVNRSTIYGWQRRADFPRDPDTATFKEYAATRLQAAVKSQRGENSELKKEKLQHQVALLREQARRARTDADAAAMRLEQQRGLYVPETFFRDQIQAVQSLMIQWWDMTVDSIAAKRKDADLLTELRRAKTEGQRKMLDFIDNTTTPETTTDEKNEA